MKSFLTKHKSFFVIFAVVFVLFWVLSLKFIGTQVFFKVLMFPFGFLYAIISTYWWNNYGPAHWLNDEILGFLLIFLVIIAQTFVYYYIYRFIKARKKRRAEIQ